MTLTFPCLLLTLPPGEKPGVGFKGSPRAVELLLGHLDRADDIDGLFNVVDKSALDGLAGVIRSRRHRQRGHRNRQQFFVSEPAALLLFVKLGRLGLGEWHEVAPVECYFADNGRRPESCEADLPSELYRRQAQQVLPKGRGNLICGNSLKLFPNVEPHTG